MNIKNLYKGYNWILTGVVLGILMIGCLYGVRLIRSSTIEPNYLVEIPLLMIIGCLISYLSKRSVDKKPDYQSIPK